MTLRESNMQLNQLRGLNIHIVGLSGAEGSAITEFLWNNDIRSITTHDFCEEKEFVKNFVKFNPNLSAQERKQKLAVFKNPELTKHFKDSYLEGIENADLIFVGQAWYKYEFNFPKIADAQKNGIPLKTIINLYLDLFPGTTIGITGSNGKTTVSSLTHHLFKNTYPGKTYIAGNIDSETQSLNSLTEASSNDVLVLEISNRQLKLLGDSKVDIAAITNITENHLDEHDSFEEYAMGKIKICQGATHVLLNNKDEATLKYSTHITNPTWFNNKEILKEFMLERSDLALPGEHNVENLYAALNILKKLSEENHSQYDVHKLKQAVQSFRGVKKRLQSIGTKNGIEIINDLSSTTPESTLKAIDAFSEKTFSIVLGCKDKGSSYTQLIERLTELQKRGALKHIFLLPGSIREMMKNTPLATTDIANFEELAL